VREKYDAEIARKQETLDLLTAEIASRSPAGKPKKPVGADTTVDVDMGFDPDSDDEVAMTSVPAPDLGPPEVPLIPKDTFLVESAKQYKLYKSACKVLPWASMYPEPKYQVGVPGVCWQMLVYDVPLRPV
jgi:hypothetical protein